MRATGQLVLLAIAPAGATAEEATGVLNQLSVDALQARLKLSMESVGALIENNCINFSVLIVKYGDFCRDLEQDPTKRTQEIREQLKPSP